MGISRQTPRIVAEGIGGALTIAGTVLAAPLLRSWYSRWGATPAEVAQPLPGDEFVPHPKSQMTCAVTVDAPPALIWPWLVQLGCQRGGWYSYDLLDNGGAPSANTIMPEHQRIAVGDIVRALPRGDFGFPVAAVDPEHALTLAGTLNTATGQPAQPDAPELTAYYSGDQTWVLAPIDAQRTRLLFRTRTDWNATRLNTLIYRSVVEPISFVMGRKMLQTLRLRAERLAAAQTPGLPQAV